MNKAVDKSALFLNTIINCVILGAFLCATFIGVYIFLDMRYVFHNAYAEEHPMFLNDDQMTQKILDTSEECVAWIQIAGTDIDYPVMYSSKNRIKYLNADPSGEYNLAGSIFLDYRNSPEFYDRCSIIHGHHMENGYMFGSLDSFQNENFLHAHQKGKLYLRNGTKYNITLLKYATIHANEIEQLIKEDFSDLQSITPLEEIISAHGNQTKLIILSTCQSVDDNERTVVIGVLSEAEE